MGLGYRTYSESRMEGVPSTLPSTAERGYPVTSNREHTSSVVKTEVPHTYALIVHETLRGSWEVDGMPPSRSGLHTQRRLSSPSLHTRPALVRLPYRIAPALPSAIRRSAPRYSDGRIS